MATIDVLEAEAGPELDAACAEVLGWRPIREADGWWGYEKPDGAKTGWSSWRPSTDIATAWELVEAMLGQRFSQIGYGDKNGDEPWWCTLLGPNWPDDNVTVWAETVPLAISRAFLIAHGVTEIEVDDVDQVEVVDGDDCLG